MLQLSIAALALGCCCAAAQAPVYKTLYLPQVTKPGGNPSALFETSPGIFSVLTAAINSTWGSTVITVTSNATSKVIYSLPPNTLSTLMVQGTNGVTYGPIFLHQDLTSYYSYFSLSASGQTAKQ